MSAYCETARICTENFPIKTLLFFGLFLGNFQKRISHYYARKLAVTPNDDIQSMKNVSGIVLGKVGEKIHVRHYSKLVFIRTQNIVFN